MSYNKHTWETGETITAEKLNNLEDGVANLDSSSILNGIVVINAEINGETFTFDKTPNQIGELWESNYLVLMKVDLLNREDPPFDVIHKIMFIVENCYFEENIIQYITAIHFGSNTAIELNWSLTDGWNIYALTDIWLPYIGTPPESEGFNGAGVIVQDGYWNLYNHLVDTE